MPTFTSKSAGLKMRCPECESIKTRVVETRVMDGTYVMRYRFCGDCGCTFRTHERTVFNAGKNKWSVTPVQLEGDE